jgi:alkylhydroperoxidase family enzyme
MLHIESLTVESAPERSRGIVAASEKRFGFLPGPVARAAHSPTLLAHLIASFAAFDRSSLNSLEREVVAMTVAFENGCHYCMAMHSATLAPEHPEVVTHLRDGSELRDARLEAIRLLARDLVRGRGQLSAERRVAVTDAGLSNEDVLDVVLGVGAYVLSTFTNIVTDAPLDPAFAAWDWRRPQEVE